MRVKMTSAPAPANTMTTRFWANKALRSSLCTFVSEANDAAVALYTITQLCSSLFGSTGIQRDVAHKLLHIAGVLSSLLATSKLDALPDVIKLQLSVHIERCQPLLQRIDAAVDKLHVHYESSERRREKVSASFVAIGREMEKEVADVLELFFRLTLRVRLGLSTQEPTNIADRNACVCDQTQHAPFAKLECLLQRVDKSLLGQAFSLFDPSPSSSNGQSGPFAPVPQNSNEGSRDSQPPTRPQMTCYMPDHSNAGTAKSESNSATSSPAHPFAAFHGLGQPNVQTKRPFGEAGESKLSMPDQSLKHPFAAFHSQSHSRYEPQIWGRSVGAAGSESKLAPPTAPAPQKHFFPIAGGVPKQSLPFPGLQPPTTSHCHPRTITTTTTTANMSDARPGFSFGTSGNDPATTVPTTAPLFGCSSSAPNTFGGVSLGLFQHFEAYILRPHAESSANSTTWSYKAEALLLDVAAMQAHIIKLGSTYSVIDAISSLQPQQMHLVQEHVKSREGQLVSVQFGAAAEIPTPMGPPMRISSVIFLLKTSAPPNTEHKSGPQNAVQHSCWGVNPQPAEQSKSLFGNNNNTAASNTGVFGSYNGASKPSLFHGFGTGPAQQSNSLFENRSFAADTGRGPFGNSTTATNTGAGLFGPTHNSPAKSIFGENKFVNAAGGLFGRHHNNNGVLSQGDALCTLKERDGASGQTVQQYMTLPAYFTQSGEKSFEEARTDDVKNGFIYKTTIPEPLFGVPASNNKFGSPVDSRGFGGWGQKAALGLPIPAFGTSVNEASRPTPSLFNGIVSNAPPNPFAASTTPTKPLPNPFANISLSQHATAAGFGQGPFSSAQGTESGRAVAQLFGSFKPASSSPFSAPSVFGAGAAPKPSTSTLSPRNYEQPSVREESSSQVSPTTSQTPKAAPAPSSFGAAASSSSAPESAAKSTLFGAGAVVVSKPATMNLTSAPEPPAIDAQSLVSEEASSQLFAVTIPAPESAPKPSLFGAGAVVAAMSTMLLKPTAPAFSPSAPLDIDASSTSTSPFTFGNAKVCKLFVEAHKARTATSSAPETDFTKEGREGVEGEKTGDAEASVGEEEKEKEKEKGGEQASGDLEKGKEEADSGTVKEDV